MLVYWTNQVIGVPLVHLSEELGEKLIHDTKRTPTNHQAEQAVALTMLKEQVRTESHKRYLCNTAPSILFNFISIEIRLLPTSKSPEGQRKRQRVNTLPTPEFVDIVIAPCVPSEIPESFSALSRTICDSEANKFGLWEVTTNGDWNRAQLGPPSPPGVPRKLRVFCVCGQCETEWRIRYH